MHAVAESVQLGEGEFGIIQSCGIIKMEETL